MPTFVGKILRKLGIVNETFTDADHDAHSQALSLTTKALLLAQSPEGITLEKLIGAEKYSDTVIQVLTLLVQDLSHPLTLDALQGIVGHYGAILMSVFKDGKKADHISGWVIAFQAILGLAKLVLKK